MNPTYDDLYPPQRKLADKILTSWKNGEPYVAQVGQRSGGSFMSAALANKIGCANTFIVAETRGLGHHLFDMIDGRKATILCRSWLMQPARGSLETNLARLAVEGRDNLNNESVVIIDQPFWMKHSELIFDTFDLYTPRILAIGSKGVVRWRNRKRIDRYATWELNPTLGIASPLMREVFKHDRHAALRDFSKDGGKLEDAHIRFRHMIGR